MHKTIGLKLRATYIKKRKLREVVTKRRKIPLYQYFYTQASELGESLLAK